MHILPHRFVRIRHFGILSNHGRTTTIKKVQKEQGYTPQIQLVVHRPTEPELMCPKCKSTPIEITEIQPLQFKPP